MEQRSAVRVLVVDDFEPFRRFICSALKRISDLRIVGEASDGLEATQKAGELRPDLIVLDIGMPMLSGLEAAEKIRQLSPKSRILIVSLESSADVVKKALNLGVLGFVAKADAGRELLPAVSAVCHNTQYLSSRLMADRSVQAVLQGRAF